VFAVSTVGLIVKPSVFRLAKWISSAMGSLFTDSRLLDDLIGKIEVEGVLIGGVANTPRMLNCYIAQSKTSAATATCVGCEYEIVYRRSHGFFFRKVISG